ncbi:hypothetical protein Ccrd_024567 [Cynara cardunculus var. scolymus]|uniref:Uncharacterized protein n=1 Tax=Cynara cardunculus var. scolymus TaxID=59895 RepID=A0A103XC78_CYNCS|nr:hypothetical protein Ccrd_024567 [Cynara cardunculus var. scolymus]
MVKQPRLLFGAVRLRNAGGQEQALGQRQCGWESGNSLEWGTERPCAEARFTATACRSTKQPLCSLREKPVQMVRKQPLGGLEEAASVRYAIVEELAGFGATVHTYSRNQTEIKERTEEWKSKGYQYTVACLFFSFPSLEGEFNVVTSIDILTGKSTKLCTCCSSNRCREKKRRSIRFDDRRGMVTITIEENAVTDLGLLVIKQREENADTHIMGNEQQQRMEIPQHDRSGDISSKSKWVRGLTECIKLHKDFEDSKGVKHVIEVDKMVTYEKDNHDGSLKLDHGVDALTLAFGKEHYRRRRPATTKTGDDQRRPRPAVNLHDGLIAVAIGVAAQLSIEKGRSVSIKKVTTSDDQDL